MVALNQNRISPLPSRLSAPIRRQIPPQNNSKSPTPIRLFLRARYYDPHTAEFTSPDPLEYVDGMSLFRGYFVIIAIDSSGTWKDNGNNIWEAEKDGESLSELAMLVGNKDARNWVCIWPKCKELWPDYPVAKAGAKADVSNLTATDGPNIIALPQEGSGKADPFIRGMKAMLDAKFGSTFEWTQGERMARKVKSVSGQGKTPINFALFAGHTSAQAGSSAIGAVRQGNPSRAFTADLIFQVAKENNNASNSLESSLKKIGPPKCWFTTNAEVEFLGCKSEHIANVWDDRIMRVGSSVGGVTEFLFANQPKNSSSWEYFFSTSYPTVNKVGQTVDSYDALKQQTQYWNFFDGTQ